MLELPRFNLAVLRQGPSGGQDETPTLASGREPTGLTLSHLPSVRAAFEEAPSRDADQRKPLGSEPDSFCVLPGVLSKSQCQALMSSVETLAALFRIDKEPLLIIEDSWLAERIFHRLPEEVRHCRSFSGISARMELRLHSMEADEAVAASKPAADEMQLLLSLLPCRKTTAFNYYVCQSGQSHAREPLPQGDGLLCTPGLATAFKNTENRHLTATLTLTLCEEHPAVEAASCCWAGVCRTLRRRFPTQ